MEDFSELVNCKRCEKRFGLTAENLTYYSRIQVPPPAYCPDCRFQRRLCERNARTLYYRKCDYSGKKIISQYHQHHTFPVYSPDIWWSDEWDPTDYAQEYDSNKPFFEQFKSLIGKTPHMAVFVIGGTLENSDFTNCTGYLKNCYLIAESDYNEDCYYSNLLKQCRSVVDCSVCYDCELCYQCVDCISCYNVEHAQDSEHCRDSLFLSNCQSCKDCIACANQRQKQYMIFNKQFTKDEYEARRASFRLDTIDGVEEMKRQSEEFFLAQPHKNLQEERNENCIGNHLYSSKNSVFCFDSKDLEDCVYCAKVSLGVKDCMDYNSWGDKAELLYDCSACGDNVYNLKFCSTCTTNVSNAEYCYGITQSSDLFGCVGLKKKTHCILNKQYSESEYTRLREQIVEQMMQSGEYGQFFPQDICPFGYNETIAMDYYPLSQKEALSLNFTWKEEEEKSYQPQSVGVAQSIKDVTDSIVDTVLACDECSKNYKIITQEFSFYQKSNTPVPSRCPDCRHGERLGRRTPARMSRRACASCGQDTQTAYPEEDPRVVYCKKCFLSEVY